jgi:hypothetical protein
MLGIEQRKSEGKKILRIRQPQNGAHLSNGCTKIDTNAKAAMLDDTIIGKRARAVCVFLPCPTTERSAVDVRLADR